MSAIKRRLGEEGWFFRVLAFEWWGNPRSRSSRGWGHVDGWIVIDDHGRVALEVLASEGAEGFWEGQACCGEDGVCARGLEKKDLRQRVSLSA